MFTGAFVVACGNYFLHRSNRAESELSIMQSISRIMCRSLPAGLCLLPLLGGAPVRGAEAPAEIELRFQSVTGIGRESGVCRRDPSDVVKVGDYDYVWYSRVTKKQPLYPSGYSATVWYATSTDAGHTWTEQGEAVGKGKAGSFDSTGVFTPNILGWRGKYYLYFTAVGDKFKNAGYSDPERTAIGVAMADSPTGPWTTRPTPILESSRDPAKFDSFRVDDSCLRIAEGKVWLYFKGRQWQNTPGNTKMGVAVSDQPEGRYRRLNHGQPIQDSGHEVQIWVQDGGVYSMVCPTGPRGNTLRFAVDGIHFDAQVVARFRPRPPMAPGLYRPELTGDEVESRRRWGICMATAGGDPYLQRFEFSLPKRTAAPQH